LLIEVFRTADLAAKSESGDFVQLHCRAGEGMTAGLFTDASAPRKRRMPEGDLDITPMIDVTFLLLIFFMVTSTMQSTPDLDLPVAHHGAGINQAQQVIVSVLEQDGQTLFIAGDPPGSAESLEQITLYVREQLELGKSGILLKASGQIPSGTIKQITQQLQSLGEVQFYYGVSERN